jgi:hypothetical protein
LCGSIVLSKRTAWGIDVTAVRGVQPSDGDNFRHLTQGLATENRKVLRVKRISMLFMMVTAFTVVLLLSTPLPAMAQTPAEHLIYFAVPNGPGGTYACNSGPPFVSGLGSGEDNCTFYQSGAPADLVCDTLTTIMFVPAAPEVP